MQIGSRTHSKQLDLNAVQLTVEHCHFFHCSTIKALTSQQIFDNGDIPYRISSKSVEIWNVGRGIHLHPKVQYNSHYADFYETHVCSTSFVKNSYRKLHENLTKALVVGSRSLHGQTQEQTWSSQRLK